MQYRVATVALILLFASQISLYAEEVAVARPATVEVQAGEVALNVPSTWEKQQPKSRLRLLQFRIPAAEGDKEDAEFSVFSFGGGSSVAQNVKRWIGQFGSKGRTIAMTSGPAQGGKYVLVNLSGIYKKPIGPPIARKTEDAPGSRMLAVMLVIPDKGVYYFKLVGPEATVAAQLNALRTAIGGDATKEKEYSLEG